MDERTIGLAQATYAFVDASILRSQAHSAWDASPNSAEWAYVEVGRLIDWCMTHLPSVQWPPVTFQASFDVQARLAPDPRLDGAGEHEHEPWERRASARLGLEALAIAEERPYTMALIIACDASVAPFAARLRAHGISVAIATFARLATAELRAATDHLLLLPGLGDDLWRSELDAQVWLKEAS